MTHPGEKEMKFSMQDQQTWVLWAADCAEHVLPHFEQAYPNDNRPRLAIELARKWIRGEDTAAVARTTANAAHAAARDSASNPAACAAARAAGHAAGATLMPGHAAHVSANALEAANAAGVTNEAEWQYNQLPEYLRPIAFPTWGK